MSDFFNNGLVQTVLAILLMVLILGLFGWIKFKRDEKTVTRILKDSGVEAREKSKTTHAISTASNLSEKRISKVCSKSSRIVSNQKDKGSWKLY